MTNRRAFGVALAAISVLATSLPSAPPAAAAVDPLPGVDTTYGVGGTAAVGIPAEPVVRHRAVVLDGYGPQMVGSSAGNMAADPSILNGISLPDRSVFVPGVATDLKATDGRGLLLAGISTAGNPVLQRLGSTADYGTAGVATVPVTVASGDVSIDQAGEVVAGLRTDTGGSSVFVAKLDHVGLPVNSWGTNGVATVDLGPGDDTLIGVVGDFVVGVNNGTLKVVRLTASGVPNAGFGAGGSVTTAVPLGTSFATVGLGTALLVGGVDAQGHGVVVTVSTFDGALSTFTLPWIGTVRGFGANDSVSRTVALVSTTTSGVRFASIRLTDGSTLLDPVDVTTGGVVEVHRVVGDAAWLITTTGAVHIAVDRTSVPATVTTSSPVDSDWGTREYELIGATAARPDHSTVVLGDGAAGVWVAAMRPDGSADPGFPVRRLPLFGDPVALHRLTDGRFLAITANGAETWFARLDASGALDPTYGTAGRAVVPDTYARAALVVDPDGATTLVGGRARFIDANGVWDQAYGDFPSPLVTNPEQVVAAHRLANGVIEYLIGGLGQAARNELTPTGAAVFEFDQPIGDVSFGSDSFAVHRPGGSITWVRPNTPGVPADQATSWRLDTVTSGTLTRSTVVRAPFVGLLSGGLALPNGDLLLSVYRAQGVAAVVRLRADGSVDTAFGREGVLTMASVVPPVLSPGSPNTVLVGYTDLGGAAKVTRLRADQPPAPVRGRYVALATPARLLDTRATGGAIAGGTTRQVTATGRLGIPSNAIALATNTTLITAAGGGWGQLYGPGTQYPGATATVTLRTGGGAASAFTVVRIGTGGAVAVRTTRAGHAIIDVYGYWVPATSATSGRWVPETTPRRVLDTRPGLRLAANSPRSVASGRPGATAVVVNITVVAPSATGSLRAMASTTTTSSAMSYDRGETRSTLAVVPVTGLGTMRVATTTSAHVVVDVIGWITGSTAPASTMGLFVPQSPTHVLDTRSTSKVGPGLTALTVSGTYGIPATARGVMISVISTNASRAGSIAAERWVKVAPMIQVPAASAVVADSTMVPISAQKVALRSSMPTHLVVDVVGWFT